MFILEEPRSSRNQHVEGRNQAYSWSCRRYKRHWQGWGYRDGERYERWRVIWWEEGIGTGKLILRELNPSHSDLNPQLPPIPQAMQSNESTSSQGLGKVRCFSFSWNMRLANFDRSGHFEETASRRATSTRWIALNQCRGSSFCPNLLRRTTWRRSSGGSSRESGERRTT